MADTAADHLIAIHPHPGLPTAWNVELQHPERLQGLHSFSCHLVLYPYGRRFDARHFRITPYTEYADDLQSHNDSAYALLPSRCREVFGLVLAVLLGLLFAVLKPDSLLTLESVVSVLGVYIVGKELGDDVVQSLIDFTAGCRLSVRDRYYRFQREKNATLWQYSAFARHHRYGKASAMASRMDFIRQTNSQTVRLLFTAADLAPLGAAPVHLLSLRFEPAHFEELKRHGFLLGIKLSFNRRAGPYLRCHEVFQSLHRGQPGCLDGTGTWVPDGSCEREILQWSRLRYLLSLTIRNDQTVVGFAPDSETDHSRAPHP